MNTKYKNVQIESHSLYVLHTQRRPQCAQDEGSNARKSQGFVETELDGDDCVSEAKNGSSWCLSRIDPSETERNMQCQKFRALYRCS